METGPKRQNAPARLFARLARGMLCACLTIAASFAAGAEDAQVNITNWADYIGRNTIAEFEKATGIKVVYDIYDSDAGLEAKVMAGESGYDVVTAPSDYFGRQIKAGVYQPLDRSKLPNWGNLDPHLLAVAAAYDPGNAHAAPYLHGVNGFAYNVDMVRARMPNAPVDSLDMLFKPEIVAKFADCGVTFLDSPEDVIQLALNYLHLDPNTTRKEDYKAAEDLIMAVRPYIRSFDSAGFLNGLPNKELCVAMSWSGDYQTARARAREAGVDVNLAFTVPKEGANEWLDAFLIPADAPHPEAAHKFIAFMLDPKIIAEVTNDIHYGNDNRAAAPFIDKDILDDPAIYPPPEVEARLYQSLEVNGPTERLRTRTWTRIKTGK
jgi:putrescine transport system substrate-binding protein